MLNPDCTPGEVVGHAPSRITASCGCGWEKTGFTSRSAAKRAQKEHRFPEEPEEFVWDGQPRYKGRPIEDVDLLANPFSHR